jgi:hypothetical protein
MVKKVLTALVKKRVFQEVYKQKGGVRGLCPERRELKSIV